jgi:acetyltransferase-like isoleucine patch superfamily enzyme
VSVYVHPQGLCEAPNVGSGTRIWAFAHVLPQAVIGADCNICDHVFVENDVVVGDRVTVKCGVQLWDGIRLEDDVFVGPNATFTNDRMPRSKVYPAEFLKTVVRRGASIGANATILPGLTIGERSLVAAGSVVTHDVPARVLVRGSPARPVSFLDADLVETAACGAAVAPYELLPGVRFCRLQTRRPGTLVATAILRDIPFAPRSFTAVAEPPDGGLIGDHARIRCSQFVVLVSGAATALVDNACERFAVRLSAPGDAILLPPGTWGGQLGFASGSVLGIFASEDDDEADYVRDYGAFLTRFGR